MRIILLSLLMLIVGCNKKPSGIDSKIAEEEEKNLTEAHRQVGLPKIVKFREKRLAKEIYEMRDSELVTYTYIVDMHGKLHFLGQTMGYGLPYSTQFSNPNKLTRVSIGDSVGYRYEVLPQAEPNALFMPTSSSATWVMMKTPDGLKPQYVEPQIMVFTFKLPEDSSLLAK